MGKHVLTTQQPMDVLVKEVTRLGLPTLQVFQKLHFRKRCLILGEEEILRQGFIHGTHLELLLSSEMDVDSMEEILMGVMGKILCMGAVVEAVFMEWDVEVMLGVSQH